MKLHPPGCDAMSLDRPRIMGILNITPDSFSDGGTYDQPQYAIDHARLMLEAGADIIDIGPESTRPGASRIPAAQQMERAIPIVRAVRAMIDEMALSAFISIDTTRAAVAEAALDAGAAMINDVSAGRDDSAMFALAAARGVPIALMHMRGRPATMQDDPHYEDVVGEVKAFLLARASEAQAAGVPRENILIDPGIGFGKNKDQDLALLTHLEVFVDTGYPVLLGASRKRIINDLVGGGTRPADRVGGTCAITALAVAAGVRLVRVHDVAANRQAATVAWAMCGGMDRNV